MHESSFQGFGNSVSSNCKARNLHSNAENTSTGSSRESTRELSSAQELRALMTQTTEVLKEVFRRPKSEKKDKKPADKPTSAAADTDKAASDTGQSSAPPADTGGKRATMLRVLQLIAPERRLLGLAVREHLERAGGRSLPALPLFTRRPLGGPTAAAVLTIVLIVLCSFACACLQICTRTHTPRCLEPSHTHDRAWDFHTFTHALSFTHATFTHALSCTGVRTA
jgi:hypothetical protein